MLWEIEYKIGSLELHLSSNTFINGRYGGFLVLFVVTSCILVSPVLSNFSIYLLALSFALPVFSVMLNEFDIDKKIEKLLHLLCFALNFIIVPTYFVIREAFSIGSVSWLLVSLISSQFFIPPNYYLSLVFLGTVTGFSLGGFEKGLSISSFLPYSAFPHYIFSIFYVFFLSFFFIKNSCESSTQDV
ncbi:MAG: hypothetical protein ACTSXG_02245 [Alphaproteobacteria bacterium]